MTAFLDPRFNWLRLVTVGKRYVPRMKLYKHCVKLGVSNQVLSEATGGRFTAEFFRSLGEFDDDAMPDPKARHIGRYKQKR